MFHFQPAAFRPEKKPGSRRIRLQFNHCPDINRIVRSKLPHRQRLILLD